MATSDGSGLYRMLAESVKPSSTIHHQQATAFLASFLPQASAWAPLLSAVEDACKAGDSSVAFVAANAILDKVGRMH